MGRRPTDDRVSSMSVSLPQSTQTRLKAYLQSLESRGFKTSLAQVMKTAVTEYLDKMEGVQPPQPVAAAPAPAPTPTASSAPASDAVIDVDEDQIEAAIRMQDAIQSAIAALKAPRPDDEVIAEAKEKTAALLARFSRPSSD
jgi:hypothetical protein